MRSENWFKHILSDFEKQAVSIGGLTGRSSVCQT